MGDFLIVALTLDEFLNKGPGRPIHTWEDRAFLLRSLRCVDHVIAAADGADVILQIRPAIFVKGADCFLMPVPDKIAEACKIAGTEIRFTSTPKMSSTEIVGRLRGMPS